MPAPDKFEDLHLSDLSLEPLDTGVLNFQPTKPLAPEKTTFHAETRSKKGADRRVNPDRRQVLRFEPDRRSGKDRRPHKTWEAGKNI